MLEAVGEPIAVPSKADRVAVPTAAPQSTELASVAETLAETQRPVLVAVKVLSNKAEEVPAT